eukprot:m.97784 g.97784  ORF g.97784 m.97784 type:complete len:222 (-) comp15237_c0_seq2:57-722(-)
MLRAGMGSSARRGLLIVLEGCDRCGKSTQCARLVDRLNAMSHPAELVRFPDRSTKIGATIDAYLKKQIELDDHAAHLLFSANRWELMPALQAKLEQGVTLVVDRYAFSGVAFSSAKESLDLEWCKQPDAGLPVPDMLLHLELAAKEAESRGGFGDERYEVSEFQSKVKHQFSTLYASLSSVVPVALDVTGLSIDQVGDQIESRVLKALAASERPSASQTLW